MIDETGKQLGILALSDALREADNRGYDLVEVAPGVHPPVCRIMDYGRYRYQLKQKEKEQLRHQRHLTLKEMKFGLKIGAHDLDIKVGHVRRFLMAGHKTKITVYFRGREIIRPEFGFDMVNRVIQKVHDISIVDSPPKQEGKQINLVLAPHIREVRKEVAKPAGQTPSPEPAA
ncbi:MAG: translation initiation factor IF-3 [Nitrospirae bacterium]|nr:translation initiation factor IF-3 [Nitrospirota bacterium]